MGTSPQDSRRSGFRKRPGAEIYFEHDVRREAGDGAGHLLQRDGSGREEDERRFVQAVQEGDRELQAGAGSEDATRGWRELSGSGGSEPVPQAIAGDSLAELVSSDAQRQDHDRQAGGRNYGCGEWPRWSSQEKGGRAPHGGSEQGFRALSLVARTP